MADAALQISQLKKAVEFAHYLAKGAERLIDAVHTRDSILVRIEDGEEVDEDLEEALARAQEAVGEFTQGLRGDVYEFRKRADRIGLVDAPAAAPAAPVPAPTPAAPAVPSEQAAAPTSVQPSSLAEVPDYLPAAQRGAGLVTYWLWYGKECVSTVRMPPGTGAVDVRYEAAKGAVIFCDRARGESPIERRTKIMHSTVKVYDDRPAQEIMRRDLPFEFRGLFPNELPFLELTFRSAEPESVAEVHVRDIAMGLQNVALAEGLEASFRSMDGAQRLMHIETEDREAIGRVELALKAYLAERGAELVVEFGVGYVRLDPNEAEAETEVERPRG